jgi:hypothetical protein
MRKTPNLTAFLLSCRLSVHGAAADNAVVGINIWNEHWICPAAQDAAMRQMAEGGVTIIRTGVIDYNIDFIIKAYRYGISSG